MRSIVLVAGCCVLAACGGNKQAGQNARADSAQNAPVAAPAAAAPASQAPNAHAAAPAAPAAGPVNGQAVYGRTCVTCHQANGQGLAGAFPPIGGSPYVTGDKAKLIRIVLNGVTGPVTVAGKHFNGVMPPWKGQLSDAEIAALLTYERSSFGNSASAVSAEEVRTQRAATASRATPWTIGELER